MSWQEGTETVLKADKQVEADLGWFKLECLGSSGYGFETGLDANVGDASASAAAAEAAAAAAAAEAAAAAAAAAAVESAAAEAAAASAAAAAAVDQTQQSVSPAHAASKPGTKGFVCEPVF